MHLAGKCACGTIQYETHADPIVMLNCHCSDCRKANGSAYAPLVIVPKKAVKLQGEPRFHKVVGRSGKNVERGFCPNCGSQVTMKLERLPDILGLQAGSFEDPSIYRPAMDAFTASAQPWDHMDPAVQKHTHGLPTR